MSNKTGVLANYPAMTPPPGVLPNFDHPQTDGKVLIVVETISSILPFIAVVLRLYMWKCVSRQPIWWDDGQWHLSPRSHTLLDVARCGCRYAANICPAGVYRPYHFDDQKYIGLLDFILIYFDFNLV